LSGQISFLWYNNYMINDIIGLYRKGATLKHFNGATWYIEEDGLITVYDTVMNDITLMSREKSESYLASTKGEKDFLDCINAYLEANELEKIS